MTTLSAQIQDFTKNHSMAISEKLAVALIANFGGEKEFLEDYKMVTAHGIRGGYGRFVFNNTMVTFHDENKRLIKKAMIKVAESRGYDSLGDFVWADLGADDEWTKDEVLAAVYKTHKKVKHEDLDPLLDMLYVWQVQLLGEELCAEFVQYLSECNSK